jgi:Ca-activated chloride channel family protein
MATAAVVTVGAFVLAASVAPRPLVAAAQSRQGTIQVETNLVEILASVIDAHGRPIPDLTEDQFELSEEGVPQKIERFEAQTNRPLDLALMVDCSASTYKDLKFESDAAAHFVRQVVRPGDRLSVFEFDEDVTQLAAFSDNVPQLEAALKKFVPGAGTSIYDALVLGSNALRKLPQGRRRAIVLVTDAGETTSVAHFEDARRASIASGALLYSIIIRPVKNENGRNTAGEHALITIMDSMGGAMFILDDLSQITSMFDQINRELRTQYLLGYYPNPVPPPGSYGRVDVKVKGGATVHFRKGYFAAGARPEGFRPFEKPPDQ